MLGFTSLVPDFLSLGHWATKAKLTNSKKITVNSKTFVPFYSVSNIDYVGLFCPV